MRFLALLNLFLYVILSLHTAFDGQVQVLCIEKNGHTAIETYDFSKIALAGDSHSDKPIYSPVRPGQCHDCTDYYLGTDHPEPMMFASWPALEIQNFELLQILHPDTMTPLLSPLERPSPPAYPPIEISTLELSHIPSTVLLI